MANNKNYQESENEKEINKVINHQKDRLDGIQSDIDSTNQQLDESTLTAEELLSSIGKGQKIVDARNRNYKQLAARETFIVRPWEEILREAEEAIPYEISIQDMFTPSELKSNEAYLVKLREDFDSIHRLDAVDYTICGVAGILSAAVDIFMVGMPASPLAGIEGGTLSNYIRTKIEEFLPPGEIKKLERENWVPYDSANNSSIKTPVEGLSSYFHRFHSLGHDPVLGFIFGVSDLMNGTFTAIDKNGNLIKQVVKNQETIGISYFEAIDRVFGHMKSDIATSRGLPAPFMTLLNLFQFGSIGEEGLSIAEIGRAMYGQGYDFVHFLSMSVPVVLNEVIVRACYCAKRVNEGYEILESLPIDSPLNRKPKLSTMLFISHSIATAANTGKIAFTENPLAINGAQWLAFTKYSLSQLKWVLFKKPALREKYVQGFLDKDWVEINSEMDVTWNSFTQLRG
jgi:hypothetical protein